MSTTDQLRIQVLQLESRLGELTIEVIQGRTEIAEKVDKLAQEVLALRTVVLEIPALVVQAIDAARKAP